MPPMAPMNWMTILIFISILLLTLTSNMYFSILYMPKNNIKQKKIKILNMMMSLFSSFYSTTSMFSMNWLSMLILFLIIPYTHWFIPSRKNMLWFQITLLMLIKNCNKSKIL